MRSSGIIAVFFYALYKNWTINKHDVILNEFSVSAIVGDANPTILPKHGTKLIVTYIFFEQMHSNERSKITGEPVVIRT